MSFTGKDPAVTYQDILYVDNSNNGVDATKRSIKSGEGSSTACSISTDAMILQPQASDTTNAFVSKAKGGTNLFQVDSTNSTVKALGVHTNTQYAYFGFGPDSNDALSANTHYAVPFFGMVNKINTFAVDIGTGTDPDTTFTTANTNTQYASQLAQMMWYVPDNISIDAVHSIEGADAATGDTTRMHLMSYTFTSGSTSALTSGTLLAHNSDVTNAGNEQAYLSTWTIDSAAVTSGKVILATFRSDSVNSDYTINITVKYHITG